MALVVAVLPDEALAKEGAVLPAVTFLPALAKAKAGVKEGGQ